jgi:hypothetical protein
MAERHGMRSDGTMDWVSWHESYADDDSSLSRRLRVVRRRIGEALDAHGDERPVRILSLCAGEGRDVLPELQARPWLAARVTLVELHDQLAAAARTTAASRSDVDVRQGDAGAPMTFADALPVDLLLLCGIFGNVSTDDIHTTVAAVPAMVARGGTVIWTRGRHDDTDLRPVIRGWFVDVGLEEVAFDGEPERFGVGVARARADAPRAAAATLPDRLFTFVC